jgi:hypothetical protein
MMTLLRLLCPMCKDIPNPLHILMIVLGYGGGGDSVFSFSCNPPTDSDLRNFQ